MKTTSDGIFITRHSNGRVKSIGRFAIIKDATPFNSDRYGQKSEMKIILTLVFSLILLACDGKDKEDQYTYAPTRFDGSNFVVSNSLESSAHYDRVEKVLQYYKVGYKRIKKTEIVLDKPTSLEMLFNYTKKSEDSDWLASHVTKP